jgi:hypothetical protein
LPAVPNALRPAGLFALLGLATGPILADWLRHVALNSWTLPSLAFPFLLTWIVSQQKSGRRQAGAAIALSILGSILVVGALLSGAPRLGRPGVLLGVAAILLLFGRLQIRSAVLLALCLPIPSFIQNRVGQPLLPLLASLLTEILEKMGPARPFGGLDATRQSALRFLAPEDLGISFALLAAGISWARDAHRVAPVRISLINAACAAFLGIAIHTGMTLAWLSTGQASASSRSGRDLAAAAMILVVMRLWPERRPGGADLTRSA